VAITLPALATLDRAKDTLRFARGAGKQARERAPDGVEAAVDERLPRLGYSFEGVHLEPLEFEPVNELNASPCFIGSPRVGTPLTDRDSDLTPCPLSTKLRAIWLFVAVAERGEDLQEDDWQLRCQPSSWRNLPVARRRLCGGGVASPAGEVPPACPAGAWRGRSPRTLLAGFAPDDLTGDIDCTNVSSG